MNNNSQLIFDFSSAAVASFEDYISTQANQQILKALEFDDLPSQAIVFLWGQEGAGKSHLLQACCNRQEGSAYIPLSKYAEYGPEILEGLESLSLVCIDDLDLVLGNRAWEEALFYFFNTLQQSGTHLLLAAKQPPAALAIGLKDLQSRFQVSLVYQLEELDEDAKKEALIYRALQRGMPLETEVLNYIYSRSKRNMHDLAAVIDRLDQLSLAEKRKLTIPFVKQTMGW